MVETGFIAEYFIESCPCCQSLVRKCEPEMNPNYVLAREGGLILVGLENSSGL